ncbi:hypothetical protein [Rubrivivax gelatinosus]|uniref:hypothetical protein n=1 Tax=Rubrivivax gelatinosus TaxID=28068 RepID=UPI0019068F95|nr:hypothetical protein [Rubrivivax gelatinosus]
MEDSNLTSHAEERTGERPLADTQPRRPWVTPRVERISTSDTQTSTVSFYRLDGGASYS